MLVELQHFLARALRTHEPIPKAPALAQEAGHFVAGNARVSPAEQVDIYRRQFWLRHVDSLREDYPGLAYVLGDDGLELFCHAYLDAHPPRTPSLRELGADVPAFAAKYAGFPEEKRSLARELAAYETAFVDVFDGAEVPALDAAKLAAMPPDGWERARLVVHPRLVLTRVHHPVHELRYRVKLGEQPDVASYAERREVATHLAVYRKDDVIHYEVLDPEAFALLTLFRAGKSLVAACAEVSAGLTPEGACALEARLGGLFAHFTACRFLVDVELR
jgi:hypothetical protein